MGWTIGIPSLKLNTTNSKSKHCGNFYLIAAEALLERLGRDPDINPELSHLNVYYGFRTAKELINYSNEHCSALKDAKGRALRSDAVRMCVTLLKPPAAYMATLTRDEQLNFFHDGIEKINELVGEENIKSIAIHFDEQGPHAHIFWEPMTQDGRLCAKERHGLKFFGRLNKELPQHLRNCGWSIDDCNAYDQAQANLMNEQEKAERRRKNGRSSSVFKAEAEMKRNRIDLQIETAINDLDQQISARINQSIEDVLNDNDGTYDNVLFLMSECDDARFKELDEEGRRLKKMLLKQEINNSDFVGRMLPLTKQIRDATPQELPWKTRMALWEKYRQTSESFWDTRLELKSLLDEKNWENSLELYEIKQSYYLAVGFLYESRNIFSTLIAIVWMCSSVIQESKLLNELAELRAERRKLMENTASFKKYSTNYRNQLKHGKYPLEYYLNSMETIIRDLDNEYRKIKDIPQYNSVNNPTKDNSFSLD